MHAAAFSAFPIGTAGPLAIGLVLALPTTRLRSSVRTTGRRPWRSDAQRVELATELDVRDSTAPIRTPVRTTPA